VIPGEVGQEVKVMTETRLKRIPRPVAGAGRIWERDESSMLLLRLLLPFLHDGGAAP
jgi:hypothetical protein